MTESLDCAPDVVEQMLLLLPRAPDAALVGRIDLHTCYCLELGVVLVRGSDLTAHWPPMYRIRCTV